MMQKPHQSVLHDLLRQVTKLPHHVLDHHHITKALVSPSITAAQYGNALVSLHGIYVQTEDSILSYLSQYPELFDYASRRKLPALESDLSVLERTPIPIKENWLQLQSVGALIGTLYTLEGATLGGQFIARHLRSRSANILPMRFFDGYGESTFQRWQDFWQFADRVCPLEEYELAASTAALLFKYMTEHFDECDAMLQQHDSIIIATFI